MRNLQDVIDMCPESIYASFSSKKLFNEAIQNYTALTSIQLKQCLEEESSTLLGLKLFIKKVVIDDHAGAPSGLCMLVKTIGELTNEHKKLLTEAKRLLIPI